MTVQRLKLAFRDPRLALASRAVACAALIAIAVEGGLRPVPTLVALVGTRLLSGRSGGARALRTTNVAWVLAAATLLLGNLLSGGYARSLLYGGASALWYVLMGIRGLVLIRRVEWSYTVRLFVSYFVGTVFFSVSAAHALAVALAAFAALYLAWEEFFRDLFSTDGAGGRGDVRASLARGIAGVLALITLEALWVTSFLPFGVMRASLFAFLVLFGASMLLFQYIDRRLSQRRLLSMITFFTLATIVLFSGITWTR